MSEIKCDKCGFSLDYNTALPHIHKLKILREHLIMLSLFGCDDCKIIIKNKIDELKKEK